MKTMTKEEQMGAPRPLRARLQISLAFFAFILIGANDGAVGVLLPSMIAHYHVDKGTIGLLFLSMVIGYVVSAFNSGLLVAKLGHRLFLILGATLMLLAMSNISLTPPFLVMLA